MKNPDLDIYTTDGRINPDKAFALVQETMKTLTADEFRRLATTPVKIRGVDSATGGESLCLSTFQRGNLDDYSI